MERWITLEELAEQRHIDVNLLYLMVYCMMLPHRVMLSRIYVNTEELKRWEALENGKFLKSDLPPAPRPA